MSEKPVDALILPVMATAALVPGNPFYAGNCTANSNSYVKMMTGTAYIAVANVVDYTTIVIPVTYAQKIIDRFDNDYDPISEMDKEIWESCA